MIKGPSPDEETLVEFAKDMGIDFLEATEKNIKINLLSEEVNFELFRRMEFNSDRKRSSVLV